MRPLVIDGTKGRAGAWIARLGCVIALGACGDAVGTPIRSESVMATDGAVASDALASSWPADAADAVGAEPPIDAAEVVDAAQPDAAHPDSDGIPENAYCSSVAQWPAERVNAEQALFDAIDEIRNVPEFLCGGRAFRGLPLLGLSPQLRCSARLHSVDMAQRGFFSFTNPDGITPPERMQAAGFGTVWLWAEWIGQDTDPDRVLEYLMERDTWGCEYLTDGRLTAIGIGYYEGYWTIDLAAP